jgi:hypothetical protein
VFRIRDCRLRAIIGKTFFLVAACLIVFLIWNRFTQVPHLTEAQAFLKMWEWYTATIVLSILSLALLQD